MWAFFEKAAMVAAVILPLFNFPLIIRVFQRKSSQDISIFWAVGVWVCFVIMAPSGFTSKDMVWRIFNIVNFICFSMVTATVLYFRKGGKG